jgi:hypothetical protein
MNTYGDLRYVVPGEFEAFRDEKSAEIRDIFFEQHKKQLEEPPPPEGLPEFNDEYRKKWDASRPLGWFEHRYYFGPNGKYGKWIRGHNTIIKINETIFVHGGICPKYVGYTIRQINEQVRSELKDFSKIPNGMIVDPEGPLWCRLLAIGNETLYEEHVNNVLASFGARRIVVGHTPTAGAVIPRFGGKVIIADVGLSQYYGARLACLVIEKDKAFALHRGEKLEIRGESDVALLEYLKRAARLDPEPSPLAGQIKALEAKLSVEAQP